MVLSKIYRVHRLVAKSFIPNPENKPQVNHKDDNKFNNSVNNLEWVTASENIIHSYRTHIRSKKYSKDNHMTKLSNEEVKEIRERYSIENISQRKLGEEYGVSQTHIGRIINNIRRVLRN